MRGRRQQRLSTRETLLLRLGTLGNRSLLLKLGEFERKCCEGKLMKLSDRRNPYPESPYLGLFLLLWGGP